MEISDYEVATRTLQVDYDSHVIEVTYRPHAYTYKIMLLLRADIQQGIVAWLKSAIVDWTLTRNGRIILPMASEICALPADIVHAISAAMMADIAVLGCDDADTASGEADN